MNMEVQNRGCYVAKAGRGVQPNPAGAPGLQFARLGMTLFALTLPAISEPFVISTPGGDITIDVPHVAPKGFLVQAEEPTAPGFRPPSIFSAPLPSGSGARAIGIADSFTAVADDATAASWNPGGLTQLERPEFSIALRLSNNKNTHSSGSDSFSADEDDFQSENINYMSFVYPFQAARRNMVLSLNFQEAYDFTQQFSARAKNASSGKDGDTATQVFTDTVEEHVVDGNTELDVTSVLTTRKNTVLNQVLNSDLLTDIDFEQEGVVYGISPAYAVAISPKFSVGAAINIYQDGEATGQEIRSETTAKYNGKSNSRVNASDTLTTSGTYSYNGVTHLPPGGSIPIPIDVPFSGSGEYEPFSDTETSSDQQTIIVDGEYNEVNTFDDLSGYNLTLGGLWTVTRKLRLGASLETPWTADAKQSKTVRNTVTTYDASGTRVLDTSSSEETTTKDVEFDFPLRWAMGGLWRWTDLLYTTIDISRTHWSDFSFQAEGEQRINPLDGTPYGQNPVDDTWRVSGGIEYLLLFRKTEVPLRAGVAWEERPATDSPDEFWQFTLGSGVSIGQGPGKIIIDFAYVYSFGNDVLGTLVPGQDLGTDVEEHEFFISVIKHL